MDPVVTLTAKALENVQRYLADNPDGALRLGVRGGGCSGFQYSVTIDHPQDSDVVYEQGGVTIAVPDEAVHYLVGSTLDYKDTMTEAGFAFDNPNATGGCGCGSSFRVDSKQGCDTTGATLDGESPLDGVYGHESAL
jgi:iron-sulfur cluster assembly accessory protein